MVYVAPIVEGHGEVEAVPKLLHRIRMASGSQCQLVVNPPIRVKSGSFLNDGEYFTKQVALAAAKAAQNNGSVLIILDCDDDCPARIGPDLLARAKAVRADVQMFVALAYREYESWFIAAVPSLSGVGGLLGGLAVPANLELIRDAKGWLGRQMPDRYDPITHQLAFTLKFDLAQARACPSFDRLFRHVSGLCLGG